jgi:hypothetical protein
MIEEVPAKQENHRNEQTRKSPCASPISASELHRKDIMPSVFNTHEMLRQVIEAQVSSRQCAYALPSSNKEEPGALSSY